LRTRGNQHLQLGPGLGRRRSHQDSVSPANAMPFLEPFFYVLRKLLLEETRSSIGQLAATQSSSKPKKYSWDPIEQFPARPVTNFCANAPRVHREPNFQGGSVKNRALKSRSFLGDGFQMRFHRRIHWIIRDCGFQIGNITRIRRDHAMLSNRNRGTIKRKLLCV
jgi:hypothetical protein